MSSTTPGPKVAIPPTLAHQSLAKHLPPALHSALLAALYASPDTIPRLQTTLSAALATTPPAAPNAATPSFSHQVHDLLLALVRAARTGSSGDAAALDEAALAGEVMHAVRRARGQAAGVADEEGQARLQLDARAREEIVRVVRQEVARVAVVRDEGFDTPLGRMYQ